MNQTIYKSTLLSTLGIAVGLFASISPAKAVNISSISNLEIDGTTYDVDFTLDSYDNIFTAQGRTPTFLGDLSGAQTANVEISNYLNNNGVTTVNNNDIYFITHSSFDNEMIITGRAGSLEFFDNNNWNPNTVFAADAFQRLNHATFEVPEPLTILGSLAALGMGAMLKRKYDHEIKSTAQGS